MRVRVLRRPTGPRYESRFHAAYGHPRSEKERPRAGAGLATRTHGPHFQTRLARLSKIQFINHRIESRFERRLLLLELAHRITQPGELRLLGGELPGVFLHLLLLPADVVQALDVLTCALLVGG